MTTERDAIERTLAWLNYETATGRAIKDMNLQQTGEYIIALEEAQAPLLARVRELEAELSGNFKQAAEKFQSLYLEAARKRDQLRADLGMAVEALKVCSERASDIHWSYDGVRRNDAVNRIIKLNGEIKESATTALAHLAKYENPI